MEDPDSLPRVLVQDSSRKLQLPMIYSVIVSPRRTKTHNQRRAKRYRKISLSTWSCIELASWNSTCSRYRCHGILVVSVTVRREHRGGNERTDRKVDRRGEQRESPEWNGRRQREWRRVTPVGTSSFDTVCSSRRTRNYPSISMRRSSLAQLTSISRLFLFSRPSPPPPPRLSFHSTWFFRRIVRASMDPFPPCSPATWRPPPVRTTRVTCRLSSGSFAVITAGTLNPPRRRCAVRKYLQIPRMLSIPCYRVVVNRGKRSCYLDVYKFRDNVSIISILPHKLLKFLLRVAKVTILECLQ